MSYFEKYLKYKNKYLELKNIMKGGEDEEKKYILFKNFNHLHVDDYSIPNYLSSTQFIHIKKNIPLNINTILNINNNLNKSDNYISDYYFTKNKKLYTTTVENEQRFNKYLSDDYKKLLNEYNTIFYYRTTSNFDDLIDKTNKITNIGYIINVNTKQYKTIDLKNFSLNLDDFDFNKNIEYNKSYTNDNIQEIINNEFILIETN